MSKKRIKFSSILLALGLTLTPVFSSCSNKDKEEGKEETGSVKTERVYDFEKTVTPIHMHENFGVIHLNKEAQYVAEGKGSLKLTPTATVADQLCVYLPLRSDVLAFSYADLSKYGQINLKVYAEAEYTVDMGLYFSSLADLKSSKTSYKLKAGWNDIQYEIAHSIISIQYDYTQCWGMYLLLDKAAQEAGHSFYVDDISIVETSQKPSEESSIYLVSTNDYFELADFEHAYQKLIVTAKNTYGSAPLPLVEVVKAADCGVEAASGERMLRVVSYPRLSTGGNTSTWTQLVFSDMWLKALDTTRFNNTEEYELKFDLYQAGEVPVGRYYGLEINAYHTNNTAMDWGAIISKKGEWVTYSAPLTNFQKFITSPSSFALAMFDWNSVDYNGATESEFYIDNIRIERVVKE